MKHVFGVLSLDKIKKVVNFCITT